MIIKSVRLHNIRTYLSQSVELPEGAVLLSGDIGSGKSTILLAIEFALFGISRGLFSGEALLRHGKQAGFVELAFSLDKKEVVVRRSLRRLKDSVKQEEGFLIVDGVKQLCTADELRARILEMLGYPKELLRKSKGLIYRFTVYTPQEEMKHILFEDPQLRLDTLRRVFQIEKYKLVRESSAIVLQVLREKKKELGARIEDLPQKQQQLKQLSDELAVADKKLAALAPVISETEQLIEQRQSALKSLEEKSRRLNQFRSQLAATSAVVDEKKSLIALKEAEMSLAMREISSLKSQEANVSPVLQQLSSSLSKLSSFARLLLLETGKREQLEEELSAAEQLRSGAESEMSSYEALKLASRQLRQKIASMSQCPTCLQPVSGEHKHRISSDEEKKAAELTAKSSEAAAKKSAAAAKVKQLKAELADLLSKEKVAAGLNSELKPYFELAEVLGVKVEHEKFSPSAMSIAEMQEDLARLSSARKKLDSAREKAVMLSERERALGLEVKSLAQVGDELKLLESKMVVLSSELASFGDVEAQLLQLQSEIENVLRERTQLMVQRASLSKEKEGIDSLLRMVSEEVSRMEAAKKELEEANKMSFWLEEMFLGVVAVIEKHVMMKVHQEFNSLFREWFVMLMGNETLTARINDEFTPVVEADGFEIPVENLSGGEKTSCALAYRLALNTVINNLVSTIKTKDLLILDEPTDGFSSEQLNKLRDVLAQLHLPQIIIVSHDELIESFVQRVIRIAKEQNVSRVVG